MTQGADHFVHHSGINSDGFRTLREGARVSYRLRGRAQGPEGHQRHRRSRQPRFDAALDLAVLAHPGGDRLRRRS